MKGFPGVQKKALDDSRVTDYILSMITNDDGRPDRSALTDRVYQRLKAQILDLALLPNTRLHVGRIANEFDVSATPVREALNRLTAEGLVTGAPYRGFSVSPVLSRQELIQLLEARVLIETAAAARAAEVRDVGMLRELAAAVDHMDELVNSGDDMDVNKAFNALDQQFHRMIIAASKNPFLLQAFDSMNVHMQIARLYAGRTVAQGRHANEEHRRILAALENEDGPKASHEVESHVSDVLVRLEEEHSTLGEQSLDGHG